MQVKSILKCISITTLKNILIRIYAYQCSIRLKKITVLKSK